MVKKLLSYVGEYKKWVLLAPVLMVAEVICELILPRLMAAIVDVGIEYGDMDAILKNGLLMLLLAAIGLTAGMLAARVATKGWRFPIRRASCSSASRTSPSRISTASPPRPSSPAPPTT